MRSDISDQVLIRSRWNGGLCFGVVLACCLLAGTASAQVQPNGPQQPYATHDVTAAPAAGHRAPVTAAPTAFVRDVSQTDGPALGVALGADAGGLGGVVAYYLAWPRKRLGLMPHAGLGWTAVSDSGPSLSIGLGGSFGRRNRLVVDVQFATLGTQTLTLHEERLDTEQLYAVGLLVGWEWLSRSGFFVRANVGPGFVFLPPLFQRSEGWTVRGNLVSMGVKAW